jgi:hypothetical protein
MHPRPPHRCLSAGRGCLLTLALLGGCNSLRLNTATPPPAEGSARDKTDRPLPAIAAPAALPTKYSLRVSQYYFFADFKLDADDPLFRELGDLREQVYKELQLPPASTLVQVYLFEDREKYDRFMKARYPDLPRRRAFFVAQPRTVGGGDELLVYTFRGDRIRQDLRHELTHALLHSGLKDVPLWLDEGLAEFFELPPGSEGVNPQHLEQIRKGPFAPDMGRLERLHQVADMSPAEYRESWAWVHLMLRGPADGKVALLAYLQQLRITAAPGPLQPRLTAAVPGLTDALESHLGQLNRVHAAMR